MAFILGITLLAGCVPVPVNRTDLPPCEPGELVAPTNLAPGAERIISSLDPDLNTLTWDYPGDCAPSAFRVQVFSPSEVYSMLGYYSELDGSSRSYSIGPLDVGRMYSWRVTPMSGSSLGPASRTEIFFTGPICSSADRASYLSPILLRPLDGEVVSSTVSVHVPGGSDFPSVSVPMEWDDPTTCLPPEGYTVEVSREPTFSQDASLASIISAYNSTTANFFFSPGQEWHDCGRYYWRVVTGWPWTTSGGTPEASYSQVYSISETRSFLINTTGMFCPPDLGVILTPVSPLALPPVTTPTSVTPMAGINQAANCRSGPSLDYSVLDILEQGTSLPINGRNQQGTWWQVLSSHIQINCWLSGNVIDISGDTSAVPVIQVASPPVAVPSDTPAPAFNCAQFNSNTCTVNNHPCKWEGNVCTNK